jgi:hypothetical protein
MSSMGVMNIGRRRVLSVSLGRGLIIAGWRAGGKRMLRKLQLCSEPTNKRLIYTRWRFVKYES